MQTRMPEIRRQTITQAPAARYVVQALELVLHVPCMSGMVQTCKMSVGKGSGGLQLTWSGRSKKVQPNSIAALMALVLALLGRNPAPACVLEPHRRRRRPWWPVASTASIASAGSERAIPAWRATCALSTTCVGVHRACLFRWRDRTSRLSHVAIRRLRSIAAASPAIL